MTQIPITIAAASLHHAAEIAAIYAHHVEHGTASFESVPPDASEMAARMRKVLDAGSPWLIAQNADGAVLGYAYASQFRDRPAYRLTCENSIYVAHDRRGQGLGKALLGALIEASSAAGFRQMIAVAGGGEPGSIGVHTSLGFVQTGRMRSIGRKHGKWLDTVYMQLPLGPGDSVPPSEEQA